MPILELYGILSTNKYLEENSIYVGFTHTGVEFFIKLHLKMPFRVGLDGFFDKGFK